MLLALLTRSLPPPPPRLSRFPPPPPGEEETLFLLVRTHTEQGVYGADPMTLEIAEDCGALRRDLLAACVRAVCRGL
jgi:hypothetical protein